MNKCISCNETITEGIMVCPNCERREQAKTDAIEYLTQYAKESTLIEASLDEIERLKDIATHITSSLKEVSVQSSHNDDKIAECICKFVDLENEIEERVKKSVELKKEILFKISSLEKSEAEFLIHRYIKREQFDVIANEMNYSRQQIYRIHKKALENLGKKIKK